MSTVHFVKIFLLLAFMAGCCFTGSINQDQARSVTRVKRNVYQFGKMIRCATGRSAWDYIGYGCWCGLGGSGTPVDSTDRCCKTHDECYDQISREGICFWGTYLTYYKRNGCTGCDNSNSNCQSRLCQCDADAARCFARASFNSYYEDWSNSYC